ncbi:hypothetical protein PR202_ga19603 [Eleusine coracana subsp. coracana]|uniref:Uncharacterized protein n=1 Tax=Eleusine coracana subsp. coracana TaxID=191504 RepID=A0AAV5CVK6_ELECO|nr:hypothetical protein PR202_ga19603 [Eleusine coracana subsp. coracana]
MMEASSGSGDSSGGGRGRRWNNKGKGVTPIQPRRHLAPVMEDASVASLRPLKKIGRAPPDRFQRSASSSAPPSPRANNAISSARHIFPFAYNEPASAPARGGGSPRPLPTSASQPASPQQNKPPSQQMISFGAPPEYQAHQFPGQQPPRPRSSCCATGARR